MSIRKLLITPSSNINPIYLQRLAVIGLILAGGVLLVHLLGSRDVMYRYHPLELQEPMRKIVVNLILQIVYSAALTLSLSRLSSTHNIPGYGLLIGLALLGLMISLFYNYVSNISFCCENPLATYWGFPFSWLRGIAHPYLFDRATNWTPYYYVTYFRGAIHWRISYWKWIVDFLFWWGIAWLLCWIPCYFITSTKNR